MAETNLKKSMDLIDQLSDQELDSLVDYIRHTYKLRKNQRSARAFAQLEEGDRVRIIGNTKPQYLSGMTGSVHEKRTSRITIKLDHGPVGKFRTGKVICSPSMLQKIG